MFKGRIQALFLVAVVTVTVGSYNYAQAYTFGELSLKPRIGVSEQYDDNVTFVKKNKVSDAITNIDVGVDAEYQSRLQSLSFVGDIVSHIYANNSGFDYTSENFTTTYKNELSKRDNLLITDSLSNSEEPSSFQDEFGRTNGRYRTTLNNFHGEYAHEFTEQFSVVGGYSNEATFYSLENLIDSDKNIGDITAKYALSSADTVLALYQYMQRDFKGASTFTTNRAGAGWQHYFTPQLYFDTRAGVDFLSSDIVGNKDNSMPFYSFGLTDDADPTLTLNLSFLRETDTDASIQSFRSSWQTALSATKQIRDRLQLLGSLFFGGADYNSANVSDKFRGVTLGLNYDLAHNLILNFNYTYSQVTSNFEGREYAKNRVFLGLTREF